jgi:DNA-binding transcriptional regulator YiaG
LDLSDETPEKRAARAENLAEAFSRTLEHEVFHTLTKGAALARHAGKEDAVLPPDLAKAVEKLSGDERQDAVAAALAPFTVGSYPWKVDDNALRAGLEEAGVDAADLTEKVRELERDLQTVVDLPGPVFHGTVAGKPFSAAVVVEFHSLVLDEDERRAFYPLVSGLVFEGEAGNPSTWKDEDRRELWETILRSLDEVIAKLRASSPQPPETATTGETGTTSTRLPQPDVVRPATFPVALGLAPVDKQALDFLPHVQAFRLTAKKWSTLPSWEDLKAAEVARVLEEEGERAFKRTEGGREPLLKHTYRPGREAVVELAAEGEKQLKIRKGLGGHYRFYDKRARKEYLTRLVQDGRGYVEVGLSWYGEGGPLVEEWRENQRRKAAEAGKALLLFPKDEAERREYVAYLSNLLRALDDAQKVMGWVLRLVGKQRQNPILLHAHALEAFLEAEGDTARVETALHALGELTLRVNTFDTGRKIRAYSRFLGSWRYMGAGPGRHRAGTYFLSVEPDFVGCLHVFASGKRKLSGGDVVGFDFGKKLEKDERRALGWGRGRKSDGKGYEKRTPHETYVTVDAGEPLYSKAAGLTRSQERLMDFLSREVTHKRDPVSRRWRSRKVPATAPDANEPRLYGHDAFPFLPEGHVFAAALGHFRRNPETARTLGGTPRPEGATGGARAAGLLHEMGYSLPPGGAASTRARLSCQALEDLKAVVVDYLGGVVAVEDRGGQWKTLEEAERLPLRDLLERARFYLFLPSDWRERRKKRWEDYQAERARRGETSHAWKVTEDLAEAKRSHAALVAEARGETEATPVPLRIRLRAARLERKLSLAEVGRLFGVSQPAVSTWETGTEPDMEGEVHGKPIPAELVPLVLRWVETGEAPSPSELAARKNTRGGRKGGPA